MKFRLLLLSICLLHVSIHLSLAQETRETTDDANPTSEILQIELEDGETMTGKLYLPEQEAIKQLVIFVHGTGPGTYLNPRKIGETKFNYFDLFGKEFNKQGIAFFTYNKRGVEIGDQPPMYDKVDREKFKKAVPSVEVKDLGTLLQSLRKDQRFTDSKIILFGWSEGTMLAAAAAEDESMGIDGLFLAGYAHENMFDIIKWQFSGASSMLNLNPVFDANNDGMISREEYESKEDKPAKVRKRVMGGAGFDLLDANEDGKMTKEDFASRVAPIYEALMTKIGENDEDWIWKNYFRISTDWIHEHFAFEPNKTRLLRLSIPIYIFHGTVDANVDVHGVYDLEKRFAANGKSNLHTFIFEGHDHDLNFLTWPTQQEISEGIQKIFETAGGLAK